MDFRTLAKQFPYVNDSDPLGTQKGTQTFFLTQREISPAGDLNVIKSVVGDHGMRVGQTGPNVIRFKVGIVR